MRKHSPARSTKINYRYHPALYDSSYDSYYDSSYSYDSGYGYTTTTTTTTPAPVTTTRNPCPTCGEFDKFTSLAVAAALLLLAFYYVNVQGRRRRRRDTLQKTDDFHIEEWLPDGLDDCGHYRLCEVLNGALGAGRYGQVMESNPGYLGHDELGVASFLAGQWTVDCRAIYDRCLERSTL